MRAVWRAPIVFAAALLACNSIVGFDELQMGRSSSSSGGSSSGGDDDDDVADSGKTKTKDAGPTGPRCNPAKPFGAPVIVPELDGAVATRTAVMTPDELEIFYLRGASSTFELRHARRASRNATWSEPQSEVLAPDATYLTAITAGGLKLYYWRTGATLDETDNHFATRGTAWGPGTKLIVPSSTRRPTFPVKNDDGAYYSDLLKKDDGGASGEKGIFRGNMTSTSVFSPQQLDGIHNVKGLDEWPVVNSAETTLYFSSSRPAGLGGADIHVSTRKDNRSPWTVPMLVAEVSSPSPENPTWVSDDDCVLLIDRLGHSMRADRPL